MDTKNQPDWYVQDLRNRRLRHIKKTMNADWDETFYPVLEKITELSKKDKELEWVHKKLAKLVDSFISVENFIMREYGDMISPPRENEDKKIKSMRCVRCEKEYKEFFKEDNGARHGICPACKIIVKNLSPLTDIWLKK